MRILLTNDDGVNAPGIFALKKAVEDLGEVYVVAPEGPQSASGHSITLHKPLRMNEVELADGSKAWAASGTPTDCVDLGIDMILKGKPDLVISGINCGPNLGYDLTYSGTVAAAMEGAIEGIPSFAISVTSHASNLSYDFAAKFAHQLVLEAFKHNLPRFTLLNVNIPPLPEDEIKGIEVTRVGRRIYLGHVEERIDPMGRKYYWLGGDLPKDELTEGTDVKAIAEHRISVTPIHLDLTNYPLLEDLKTWNLFSK